MATNKEREAAKADGGETSAAPPADTDLDHTHATLPRATDYKARSRLASTTRLGAERATDQRASRHERSGKAGWRAPPNVRYAPLGAVDVTLADKSARQLRDATAVASRRSSAAAASADGGGATERTIALNETVRGVMGASTLARFTSVIHDARAVLILRAEASLAEPQVFVCNATSRPSASQHTWRSDPSGSSACTVQIWPTDRRFSTGAFYICVATRQGVHFSLTLSARSHAPPPAMLVDAAAAKFNASTTLASELHAAESRRRAAASGANALFLLEAAQRKGASRSTPLQRLAAMSTELPRVTLSGGAAATSAAAAPAPPATDVVHRVRGALEPLVAFMNSEHGARGTVSVAASEWVYQVLVHAGTCLQLGPGECLYRRGERSDFVALVLRGELYARDDDEGVEAEPGTLLAYFASSRRVRYESTDHYPPGSVAGDEPMMGVSNVRKQTLVARRRHGFDTQLILLPFFSLRWLLLEEPEASELLLRLLILASTSLPALSKSMRTALKSMSVEYDQLGGPSAWSAASQKQAWSIMLATAEIVEQNLRELDEQDDEEEDDPLPTEPWVHDSVPAADEAPLATPVPSSGPASSPSSRRRESPPSAAAPTRSSGATCASDGPTPPLPSHPSSEYAVPPPTKRTGSLASVELVDRALGGASSAHGGADAEAAPAGGLEKGGSSMPSLGRPTSPRRRSRRHHHHSTASLFFAKRDATQQRRGAASAMGSPPRDIATHSGLAHSASEHVLRPENVHAAEAKRMYDQLLQDAVRSAARSLARPEPSVLRARLLQAAARPRPAAAASSSPRRKVGAPLAAGTAATTSAPELPRLPTRSSHRRSSVGSSRSTMCLPLTRRVRRLSLSNSAATHEARLKQLAEDYEGVRLKTGSKLRLGLDLGAESRLEKAKERFARLSEEELMKPGSESKHAAEIALRPKAATLVQRDNARAAANASAAVTRRTVGRRSSVAAISRSLRCLSHLSNGQ